MQLLDHHSKRNNKNDVSDIPLNSPSLEENSTRHWQENLGKHQTCNTPPPEVLTYICHVQAVLRGGIVPAGGDGGHVHAVHRPYGRVVAVEVAAVGATGHIVWTFTNTVSIPANSTEKENCGCEWNNNDLTSHFSQTQYEERRCFFTPTGGEDKLHRGATAAPENNTQTL